MPLVLGNTDPMAGAAMAGILGDTWSFVKNNPLAVVLPPLYVAQQTLKAVPTIARTAQQEIRDTVSAFRPPAPAVDPLTSALTLGSGAASPGGELGSSTTLPIIVGAVAAGGLLLLAFGRKKKRHP